MTRGTLNELAAPSPDGFVDPAKGIDNKSSRDVMNARCPKHYLGA